VLRALPVAGEYQGLGGIPQDLASSRPHPELDIVRVRFSNSAMALARASHPGIGPAGKPPAGRSALRDVRIIDERAHFCRKGRHALRVAEPDLEQRAEPEGREPRVRPSPRPCACVRAFEPCASLLDEPE
jgi:hypothetical protein